MKAFLVVSHPNPRSLNHALANAVRDTWLAHGCDVIFHDLHAEGFDPVLSANEAAGLATQDPTVQAHIAELVDCDLLGIVHPNCWGAPPAMMKGWIDRVLAPEAAYTFAKGIDRGDVPVGLLKARAAIVLNTGNTPLERERDHFGDPLDRIWRQCILSYCGVKDIHRRLFGVVATSSGTEREGWLNDARSIALDVHRVALGR